MFSRPFWLCAGILAVGAGAAVAGTAETMEKACLAELNLPPGGCACIGERAESELNPKQQEFVVAAIAKDDATNSRLRGEMTVFEMTQAAGWMVNTPKRCASQ